jgi:hypothetical protein
MAMTTFAARSSSTLESSRWMPANPRRKCAILVAENLRRQRRFLGDGNIGGAAGRDGDFSFRHLPDLPVDDGDSRCL